MKKKAIEKIPYLRLKEVKPDPVQFVGVTAVKIVGHEKHLFLEVYKNSEETRTVPLVRIAVTKKDFGTYFPETEQWTRARCNPSWDTLIWDNLPRRHGTITQECVLQSPEDLKRIKKMCKQTVWNEDRWWQYIDCHQNDIVISARRATDHRRYQRRMDALKDRMDNTPELPEQMILERADRVFYSNQHFLYYKKRGAWAQITCSKCGGVTNGRWKPGDSYESMFQKHIEEPREKEYGTCPLCGERGQYLCQGKVKGKHTKTNYVFWGQKYKEHGFVMRYIEVSKSWHLQLNATDKGDEMHGAYEELSGIEIARCYFEPGKDPHTDFQKYDPYKRKDFWDDCNLQGMNNITIGKGLVFSETYEEMQGTEFQYCALKEYILAAGYVNAIQYLGVYRNTPQIEMLVKLGFTDVVKKLINYRYGIVQNENARRPDEFLGIRKEHLSLLKKHQENVDILDVLKAEKRMNQNWTEEQILQIEEAGLRRGQMELATKYMSITKLLNRISGYANCRYGTNCSEPVERIRHMATIYTDYLRMREERGYDMTNEIILHPRDIMAEHDKMVLEVNQEREEKHMREMAEKYPDIRKNYRGLRNSYLFEDENYLIRPARSAEEIIAEGRFLHHCVGGSEYLSKHNDGRSYIMMVRQKEEPETPYVTVELEPTNGKILQWYGAFDKKPDKEIVQAFLDGWLASIATAHTMAGTA